MQEIEELIKELHHELGSVTLFRKENVTPEYLNSICNLLKNIELDLSVLSLKGFRISKISQDRLNEIRRVSC